MAIERLPPECFALAGREVAVGEPEVRDHDVPPGIAVGDLVEVRAIERPIRLIAPRGSLSFWDLLRHKVELLPS